MLQNMYGRPPQPPRNPGQPQIPPGERPPAPGYIPGRGGPPKFQSQIPPGERPPAPGSFQRPPQKPMGTFGANYAPQIAQLRQRFPGFMQQAGQNWGQMRDQLGAGWWRKFVDPSQGLQANAPGFQGLYQQLMGNQLPGRYQNYGQNRGWFDFRSQIPPGERPDPMAPYRIPGRQEEFRSQIPGNERPDPLEAMRKYRL